MARTTNSGMSTISNQTLAKPLRSLLENTVKSARDVAEKAALAALTVGRGRGQGA